MSLLRILIALTAACLAMLPRPTVAEPAQARGLAGVSAAHPLAVEAGLDILRSGGSAVDAAVAVQAMLGLVEPQSSGLGGGAFMTYYDGKTGKVTVFNGRETAPRGATPEMFLNAEGLPFSYGEAVTSGRATGVPGVVAMLGEAHARFGRLPWKALFAVAERTADEGFPLPERLMGYVTGPLPQAAVADVRRMYRDADDAPLAPGSPFRNPAYAETLRRIAEGGPRTLLSPPVSTRIIERTRLEPLPGTLTQEDFDAYRPEVVEPLCRPYRIYVVCVPPPPSSGVAVLQLLGMLERTDIGERGPADPQAWFLFAEASRLMYADRDAYVGDPDFVDVPVAGLLEPGYVAARAALIGETANPAPTAGTPAGLPPKPDATREPAGTSHFVVADTEGNVVSMTTTVESLFGSGRMVDGFFLNNQLTDFSSRPVIDGKPVANAVAGGKRPRSSMSPAIVLDAEGRFLAAVGSPGGSAILAYNAKALVGLLDWGLSMQEAISLPNLIAPTTAYFGEVGKFAPGVVEGLAGRGIELRTGRAENSGLHGLLRSPDGLLEGGADPRRDGIWQALPAPATDGTIAEP